MRYRSILITGGAGFVGANLAIALKERAPQTNVIALDNLSRRGSELNLARLGEREVAFRHGDIRCPEDLAQIGEIGEFDLLIDCSAEPSVQAGATSSPRYVLNTNLCGTINCLEAAREHGAAFLFLSTSRVYPIEPINSLPFAEDEIRYELLDAAVPGASSRGIAEEFALPGARSFYGTTKLSAELLIAEYVHSYGLRAMINRCGVLAGPWQMGKVDQGVLTLWVARHHFQKSLTYKGFGGHGKQVRDVLHINDLCDLVWTQLNAEQGWDGEIFNVGGGREVSTSLRELTALCREVTGNRIDIGAVPETNPLDVRLYLTDASKVRNTFGWKPTRSMTDVLADIHEWIVANESQLATVLA